MYSSLSSPRSFSMGGALRLHTSSVPTATPPSHTHRVLTPPVSTQSSNGKRVRNSCFCCGATAYRAVMARDAQGIMRPSGRHQCVQCRVVFNTICEWREGHVAVPPSAF